MLCHATSDQSFAGLVLTMIYRRDRQATLILRSGGSDGGCIYF